MFCQECGSDMVLTSEPIEFIINRDTVLVEGIEHELCEKCGESLLTAAAASALQKAANDAYRKKHGYLTGPDIKALRDRIGYSQEEMESLIKAGPKSFSRWEKGTVLQKGPTDVLLRVLDRFPMVFEWLRGSTSSFQEASINVTRISVPATASTDKRLVA